MLFRSRMRAIGVSPSSAARSSDITSSAAAPTLIWLELPAVTVPPSGMNAGFSAPSASGDVTWWGARRPSLESSRVELRLCRRRPLR